MTKDELVNTIETYMHHVIWANDYYDVYNSIMDGGSTYYKEACLANSFFKITRYSLISSFLIEIVKLFDQREEACLPKLINICRQNSCLFSSNIYYIVWKHNEKLSNLYQLLAVAEQDIITMEPQITKLKGRRDQYYAHSDKKYFAVNSRLADDYPINPTEVDSLLSFASGLCNSLLGALTGQHIYPHHDGNDDLMRLLMCANRANMTQD